MIICRVCKQENEEHFTYCKNCGTELEKPKTQPVGFSNSFGASPDRPAYAPYNPYNQPVSSPKATQPAAPIVKETPEMFELVGVYMQLPDVDNPEVRTLQKVFVTKKQYAAMKAAGMFGENKGE